MFTATGLLIASVIGAVLTAVYYGGKIFFGLYDRRKKRRNGE
jgi:hypothetical protein